MDYNIFPATIGLRDVDYALSVTTDMRAAHYLDDAATKYVDVLYAPSSIRGTSRSRWLAYRVPRRSWSQREADHYASQVTRWYRRAMENVRVPVQ